MNIASARTGLRSLAETESFRFLCAGGFNVFLTYLVYSSILWLGFNYIVANSSGWIVGILVSFTLNTMFVFRKTFQSTRFAKFVLSNVASYFVSTGSLYVLVTLLGVNPYAAPILVIPLVMCSNFVLFKVFVFR